MNYLVSVITPCYNSRHYIADAIQSVISQSYANWEMIIVDDCSTDRSVAVIEKFLTDPRIKLYKQAQNSGPVLARNLAISKASGDIIAFLDSDDIWNEDKLQEQLEVYKANSSCAIVFSDYEYINVHGRSVNKFIRGPKYIGYRSLLKSNYIGCLTATYNVALLGKRYLIAHGHEDYILWLSILREGFVAMNVGKSLAKYRVLSNSISSNKLKAARWQWSIYRNVEKIGLTRSIYYFIHYAFSAIIKRKAGLFATSNQ
ncbi:glycosyltransferase family 2 protein [Compostibacter hankyongensis]|uniref:Glycosyltransferase family 2 protein n=1 Tax=Compostibacter hankyongensis TaxID=1007089 RepID=A0ABP8FUY7_9BACT